MLSFCESMDAFRIPADLVATQIDQEFDNKRVRRASLLFGEPLDRSTLKDLCNFNLSFCYAKFGYLNRALTTLKQVDGTDL